MTATNQTPPGKTTKRDISVRLAVAIFVLPAVFVWLLLRSRYSTTARVIGFGWFGLFLLTILLASGQNDRAPEDARDQAALSESQLTARKEVDADLAAWAKLSPEEKFIKRVHEELLPALEGLQTDVPTDMQAMWARLGQLEYIGEQVLDAEGLKFTGPGAAKVDKLRKALAQKQAQLYPIYRAAFLKASRERLWEQDIDVHGQGRSIEFVGVLFARNANIKAAEEVIDADLRRLRFDKVTYRWIRNGDGAVYDLDSPADREITRT